MVSWKHKIFKNSEKSVKTGNLYTYKDQRGILFETKIENWFPFEWNYIRYPENTKKSTFSLCFLCKKRWTRKLSTRKSTIQLSNTNWSISENVAAQRSEKCVKSVTKWKALSQLTYRIFIKFLNFFKKISEINGFPCKLPNQ